jgi:alpha-tubulin suppressor-like RCC1 family protein
MSTINAANLELQLVQKISSTTTELELLALSVALRQLQNGAVFVVQNFADLPSAADNVGSLFYVVADARVYVAYTTIGWQLLSSDTTNVLLTWGAGGAGRLGDDTSTNRCSPGTTIGGGINWCAVGTGKYHNSAVKTEGTLWTWGCNACNQLGDGTSTTRSSPVTTAGGGTTWCAASSGSQHTAGVKTDGTLWTWGNNTAGQLGDGTITRRSSPVQTCGGGTTWCSSSTGNYHTAGVKTDGTLWTWGCNANGRLGNNSITNLSSPSTTAGGGTTWRAVSAGGAHTSAVKTDGTLWTWGYNGGGILGNGTTTSRSSPGQTCGLGSTWCAVSSGGQHTAGGKTDGTLWTWGSGDNGQLGDGTTTNRCSPGTIAGEGTIWRVVSTSGRNHTAGVKTDGTLWTWGCNTVGQLGTGSVTARCSPGTTAGGGTTWCAVSVNGGCHTIGIQSRVF